jgi:prepilin-type N-terminal cleavage/methylation domain-containing protein
MKTDIAGMGKQRVKGKNGFSLIEVLIALALLGIIGVAFLSGMNTVSGVTLNTDKRETAKNLAESQMEYVKSLGYAASYDPAPIPPEYDAFDVTIDAEYLQDSGIQKITVTITHQNKVVMNLEGYKVK